MKKLLHYIILITIILQFAVCSSPEVKEEQPDDILEEELRAEAEPIREIRERDLKEEVKKPLRKK
jgi:hypothetical protein